MDFFGILASNNVKMASTENKHRYNYSKGSVRKEVDAQKCKKYPKKIFHSYRDAFDYIAKEVNFFEYLLVNTLISSSFLYEAENSFSETSFTPSSRVKNTSSAISPVTSISTEYPFFANSFARLVDRIGTPPFL